MGEGSIVGVKRTIYAGLIISVSTAAAFVLFQLTFGRKIIFFITNDENLTNFAFYSLVFASPGLIIESIYAVCIGVLRVIRYQTYILLSYIFSFYVVALMTTLILGMYLARVCAFYIL